MYPKMLTEVIEALECAYCDDKDVMIDCLLYLKNATCREEDVVQIEKWFDEHHRCTKCGTELEYNHWREPHPECGVGVYEDMCEKYCPECDNI